MNYLGSVFLTLILFSLTACNSTKQPKKEIKENNVTERVPDNSNKKEALLNKALDDYLKALKTFNTDAIVDMTYPKLFYVIDLDLFRQYIASMMNSTDIEMTSYETNITKRSAVTTFSNETEFTQIDYVSTVNIHFLNNALYNSEEKINFLYDALIHKYGTKNIHINVKKRTLQIKKLEKLLLIKEKDSQWKFLGNNSKYRQLYPSFLPPEILKIIEGEDENETI